MKLKKPYKQYIGRVILYDNLHKHLVLKAYDEKSASGYVTFETVYISNVNPIRLGLDFSAGFIEEAMDQKFSSLTDKEKHLIIKFVLTGKEISDK